MVPTEERNDQLKAKTRLLRWQMLREVQRLLPDERVAFCMRHLQAENVDIYYSPDHQSAYYRGLMRCGSVWVCPQCATSISERRRAELEQAIERCIAQGGAIYLATYTVSHQEYDDLAELLTAFGAARKRAKLGRAAQKLKTQFGIFGTISVREVTWSKQNGWHPHCHELIFCAREIDADEYAQRARQLWQKGAEHEGLSMNEHGFQLDKTSGAIARYVTKFGRHSSGNGWDVAAEMTKAHMKHGRWEQHLTPFALLERISSGDDELKPVFLEYARCFKGKHQLVWSSGLRARLLGNPQEPSMEEIIQDVEDDEALLLQYPMTDRVNGENLTSLPTSPDVESDDGTMTPDISSDYVLGRLSRSQWSIVLRKNASGKLLEVARTGHWQAVMMFLQSLVANNQASSLLLGIVTINTSAKILSNERIEHTTISFDKELLKHDATNREQKCFANFVPHQLRHANSTNLQIPLVALITPTVEGHIQPTLIKRHTSDSVQPGRANCWLGGE